MTEAEQIDMQLSVAIISIFMRNIPLEIPHYQSLIVEKFLPEGTTHYQILSRKSHGEQIDECLRHFNCDVFVLLDIDAFPTSKEGLQSIIKIALRGELCGNMQKSAHLASERLFAAPSFMCFSKALFNRLGEPSFCPDESHDVGEVFTRIAERNGVPIHFFRPLRVVGEAKWQLDSDVPNCGPGTYFGIGTKTLNYHQYEIRKPHSHTMFLTEALRILELDGPENQMRVVESSVPSRHSGQQLCRHIFGAFFRSNR
jgi:hypothetical protein